MKKLICVGLLLALLCVLKAQGVSYTIVASDEQGLTIKVDVGDYTSYPVSIGSQNYQKLSLENAYPIDDSGSPELLLASTSVIIPENSTPTVRVLSMDFEEVDDFLLRPSKGVIYRNQNPDEVPYTFGRAYQRNSYQLSAYANLTETYHLRDFKGVSVQCYPFDYNPVGKKLKVVHSMLVRVDYNCAFTQIVPRKNCDAFKSVYSNYFLNYEPSRYTQLEENGEILVIAPQSLASAMQPYVDWKIKNGYPTTLVTLNETGSTNSDVKSYITSFYESHNLAFVVIVGDGNLFPYYTLNGEVCDNYYTEIVGDDNVPDIILGKISAENESQVTIQVNKFIQYEENPPQTSHFDKFMGVASSEGPGDNSEYDYTHIRNIDDKLLDFTYSTGYELFEGSRGGLDAAGNPTATMVANALNSGVGIINYCGHGYYNSWNTTSFSTSHIGNLNNQNMLPFIFSVACLNGSYVGQTCFAEAWLRAFENGQPKGAVGAVMSTMSQPWNPPMCGQDEMIRALAGIENVQAKHTFGGIIFSGLLKLYENYHTSDGLNTMRTWILFGDPALQVRTAVPQVLQANHPTNLPVGVQNLNVTCAVEGAKVVLTKGNQIIDQQLIIGGTATLSLPVDLLPTDTLHLLVSAFNYIPYQSEILMMVTDEPYLICASHELHGTIGENHPRYGETVDMDIVVKNVGGVASPNFVAVLSTEDSYVTLLDDTVVSNSGIPENQEDTLSNAFRYKLASNVPYGHLISFNIDFLYDSLHTSSTIVQNVYAPKLVIASYEIDDSESEDLANGRLDYGESAVLRVVIKNEGNAESPSGLVLLANNTQNLISVEPIFARQIAGLEAGSSKVLSYNVQVLPSVTTTSMAELELTCITGRYATSKSISLLIGLNMEDWESASFDSYPWQNDSNNPWIITTTHPYEGDYAVRSAEIGHSKSSSLKFSAEVREPDSISFYFYVSCEQSYYTEYDKLEFYINNVRYDFWDGEVNWTRAAYALNPGTYTFEWRYVKDYMQSSGEDLAMLDNIILPNSMIPVSIKSWSEELFIQCYPNPTSDKVLLDMGQQELNQAQALVFDIQGRMLFSQFVHQGINEIDLQEYASGIYVVGILKDNNMLKMIKIVKQ